MLSFRTTIVDDWSHVESTAAECQGKENFTFLLSIITLQFLADFSSLLLLVTEFCDIFLQNLISRFDNCYNSGGYYVNVVRYGNY